MTCLSCSMDVTHGSSATLIDWKARRRITLDYITDLVAKHYHLSVADIIGRSRRGKLPEARSLCWYFGLMYTTHTQFDLEVYYEKDRTAAVHARKRVREWMQYDTAFAQRVATLEQLITSRT
jgi:chromosomal replication initiation ATPase DnaA